MIQTGTRRARLRVLAAGAGLALGVAACGGSSGNKASSGGGGGGSNLGVDAASSVRQAARGTLDQQGFSVDVTLGVTGAQLQQIQQRSDNGDHSNDVSQKALDALAHGSLDLDIHTTNGSTLSQDMSQQSTSGDVGLDLAVKVNGNTPLELRLLNPKAYLKADLQQVAQDFGLPSSTVQNFQSETKSADAEVPGLAALGQGQWVAADLTPLEQLAKQSGSSSLSPQELRTLITNIEQAFTQNSTSQKVGTKNGRTQYNVTVDAGAFANSALSSLKNLPGLGSAISSDTSQLPTGKKVTLQVYEQSGKVVEADLDLNQFAKQPMSFPVPLRFQFGTGSTVSAPSGATNIDLSKVIQGLQAQNSGGSSNGQ